MEYDRVVVAEGNGPATRELLVSGEEEPRWLNVTVGDFIVPTGDGDNSLSRKNRWSKLGSR